MSLCEFVYLKAENFIAIKEYTNKCKYGTNMAKVIRRYQRGRQKSGKQNETKHTTLH